MTKNESLVGRKFTRLTVISFDCVRNKVRMWKCKCDCGKITYTATSDLSRGKTRSCGCFQRENMSKIKTTHGHTRNGKIASEYGIWASIKNRCTNSKFPWYKNYGGRGIKVCDRWIDKKGYINFISDMGNRPSKNHSIERIDNNGNYEPSNCKWATNKEQHRNTRGNHYITYNGETKCLTDWAEYFCIKPKTLHQRIVGLRWSIDRSLTEPINNNSGLIKR